VPPGARWERRHIAALGVIVSEGETLPSLEMGAALELLTNKARAFGGQVEGLTPAGFMLAFGLEPVEDASVRAVLAAMALRGSVGRHWRADDRARLRLAVHVGRWGVARTDAGRRLDLDATGDGWAVLRGLAGAAAPEAIVASASAAPFLRQRFHLDPIPGTAVVGVSLRIAFSFSVVGRFREIPAMLEPLRDVVVRLGDPALAGPYYFRMGLTAMSAADDAAATAAARAAIAEARRCGDAATEGRAEYLLSLRCSLLGDPGAGLAHGRRAEELLTVADRHWLGLAQWVIGLNALMAGDVAGARAAAARMRENGDTTGDSRIQSFAAWMDGLALARDPLTRTYAHNYLGHAFIEVGALDEGIAELETAVTALRAISLRHPIGRALVWLAEGYRRRGDARAEATAREAVTTGDVVGFWGASGIGRRVLALLAAARGERDEAARLLRESLDVLERAGATAEAERTRRLLAELR